MSTKPAVLHFVSGGGSGSTQAALDIAATMQDQTKIPQILVFRRKKKWDSAYWYGRCQRKGLEAASVSSSFKIMTIIQLCHILKSKNCRYLYAHGNSEHLWARVAGLWSKTPYIFQVEHNLERYSPLRKALAKFLNSRTTTIYCVSLAVIDHLVGLGWPEEKCKLAYNGIDISEFPSIPWQQRQQRVLMVSRWARQKNQKALILAASRLVKANRKDLDINFYGGGKKSWRKKGEKLIKELDLRNYVHIHGKSQTIKKQLSQAKVFVLSTHYEGFALALLEAMAAGCAVIASDVPGVNELIRHRENGLLVPPNDSEALAQAITTLFQNDALASRLALNGRKEVKALFSSTISYKVYADDLIRCARL